MKTLRILTSNSPGLLNDASIYKNIFTKYGFHVDIILNERETPHKSQQSKYDVNLFLEYISPNNFKQIFPSKLNLFMPNQELFINFGELENINYVLCKTKIALSFFKKLKKEKSHNYTCFYTKFTTNIPDNLKTIKPNKDPNLFIHLAGKSTSKNTDALIYCWIKNDGFLAIDPNIKLHITCYRSCFRKMKDRIKEFYNCDLKTYGTKDVIKIKNLTIYNQPANVETYNNLMTEANIALCISSQEGYGHYINEARFFETFVVVLDAPPMNELVKNDINGILVKNPQLFEKKSQMKYTSVPLYYYIPNMENLEKTIIYCIKNKFSLHEKGKIGKHMFIKDKHFFKKRMKKIINKNIQKHII